MRNLYRIAAVVLLGQLGLGGATHACDRSDGQANPAAEQAEHGHHRAPQAPAQHHGTTSCDHGPAVSCAAMTACSVMVAVAAPSGASAGSVGQSLIDGRLLANAERSDQPDLPPPRL